MKKVAKRKPAPKRPIPKKKLSKKSGNFKLKWLWLLIVTIIFGAFVYQFRDGLLYYLGYKSDKILKETKHLSDVHNVQVLSNHPNFVVGIDVSQYQGKIDWSKVDSISGIRKIEFAYIRATAGDNKTDKQFATNWRQAKENNMLRGAYHYYRPNENSYDQAKNFIKVVKLEKGDLPPVLDIERIPSIQSLDSLKVGLRRWLTTVEKHYKVRPIIYSGESYYTDFLRHEFKEYIFWIANYNFFVERIKDDWMFWQFTDKGTVPGIKGDVDVNIYNGTPKMLNYMAK